MTIHVAKRVQTLQYLEGMSGVRFSPQELDKSQKRSTMSRGINGTYHGGVRRWNNPAQPVFQGNRLRYLSSHLGSSDRGSVLGGMVSLWSWSKVACGLVFKPSPLRVLLDTYCQLYTTEDTVSVRQKT